MACELQLRGVVKDPRWGYVVAKHDICALSGCLGDRPCLVAVLGAQRRVGLAQAVRTGPLVDPDALREALDRTLYTYATNPSQWQQIQHNGMAQNFSWDTAAAQYIALYQELRCT